MTTRTRFAPSPTGYLHVGGARTALFSWLYARRTGGQFILRIEDTDRERSTQESIDVIFRGMEWLGLDYDEGPVFQTARMDRYREVIEQLLDSGLAYRCYCTREELDAMRTAAMARREKPRYDGRYRDYEGPPRSGVEPVIRFKNPLQGAVVVDDVVRGRVSFDNAELDDLVIARTDGSPTYNFTVVVDDMDMRMTHVIRGDDHLNNTPRQINIFRALGAEPPRYAHIPMILGDDGRKLSKRHGAVSVLQYREDGYLPDALINYLVRLGWSHGDQEIFSRDEMIALFDIKDVNPSASAFNTEKLLWLNQYYLAHSRFKDVAGDLMLQVQEQGMDPESGPELEQMFDVQKARTKTLKELVAQSRYLYMDVTDYDPKAVSKHFRGDAGRALSALLSALGAVDPWEASVLHETVVRTAEDVGMKLGKVAQPLRVALTGSAASPSIDQTLVLIGRARSLERIERALTLIRERQSEK